MSNLDKKTLISLYSGIVLNAYMRNHPGGVWGDGLEDLADSLIDVAQVMAERLEKRFSEMDGAVPPVSEYDDRL